LSSENSSAQGVKASTGEIVNRQHLVVIEVAKAAQETLVKQDQQQRSFGRDNRKQTRGAEQQRKHHHAFQRHHSRRRLQLIVKAPGQELHRARWSQDCWRQCAECGKGSQENRDQERAVHDRAHDS
jgi:hypothetical protein